MAAEERLSELVERLASRLGSIDAPRLGKPWDAAKHPRGRSARFRRSGAQGPKPPHVEAAVGVTPFRPGDDAADFYKSAKYQRFAKDMRRIARQRNVTIDHVEKAVGVWEGETEPSVAVDAHDHRDGVSAWAAELGRNYNQDGVLLFEPHPDGDSASYRFDVGGRKNETLFKAMADNGIPGGRIVGDKLEVIGKGGAFHDKVEALSRDLGKYDATVGRMKLLERDGYDAAIRQAG